MHPPLLSIIIPFYNEEQYLPIIIQKVLSTLGHNIQLIVVNDGSTDNSAEVIKPLLRSGDTFIEQKNGGKGAAVRAGIPYARGMYTIIQDADLEYDPADIVLLVEKAVEKNYHAVTGSRRLKKQKQYSHFLYYLGGITLTKLFNFLYNTKLTDQPCCYKLVKTSLLQSLPLRQNDFRFDVELSALLAKRSIDWSEVPVSYKPRTKSEGKKIMWKDWFRAVNLMCILSLRYPEPAR